MKQLFLHAVLSAYGLFASDLIFQGAHIIDVSQDPPVVTSALPLADYMTVIRNGAPEEWRVILDFDAQSVLFESDASLSVFSGVNTAPYLELRSLSSITMDANAAISSAQDFSGGIAIHGNELNLNGLVNFQSETVGNLFISANQQLTLGPEFIIRVQSNQLDHIHFESCQGDLDASGILHLTTQEAPTVIMRAPVGSITINGAENPFTSDFNTRLRGIWLDGAYSQAADIRLEAGNNLNLNGNGHLSSEGLTQAEFSYNTSISNSDIVTVTLKLTQTATNAIRFDVSIPPGEGDMLAFYCNLANESLAPLLSVNDLSGHITDFEAKANAVNLGGATNTNPERGWDVGVKLDVQGSAGGAVESVSFELIGPALTVADFIGINGNGWLFASRIQSTLGNEGSAKIGMQAPIVVDLPQKALIDVRSSEKGAHVLVSALSGDLVLTDTVMRDSSLLDSSFHGQSQSNTVVTKHQALTSYVQYHPKAVELAAPLSDVLLHAKQGAIQLTSDVFAGNSIQLQGCAAVDDQSNSSPTPSSYLDCSGQAETVLDPDPAQPETLTYAVQLEGVPFQTTLAVIDPWQRNWTFVLDSGPMGLTISSSGNLNWPSPMPGTHQVQWHASSGCTTVSQSFSIQVDQANQAPVITSSPVTSVNATEPYAYDVEATDGDGDTLVFSLTTAPVGMTIDPLSGLVTWNPAESDEGNHAISILVDDQNGGTDTQSFTLTVGPVPNQVPVITSSPVTSVNATEPYAYDVEATDGDGDTLVFSLTTAPVGMSIDPAIGLINWNPAEADEGNHAVAILVDDQNGGTDTQSFTLTVGPAPNQAPIITSSPVTSVNATEPYAYAVDATDGDGDTLVFSLTTAPAGMNIDPATGLITWNPAEADEGNHVVAILVDDQNGGTDNQSFTLTVGPAPNQAPVITSSPVTSVNATEPYAYDVDATDGDGDTLVFSLTTAPAGMTIDPASGLITWNPAEADEGNHVVAILVDDQNGGTDSQNFTLTVGPAPNQAPVITSSPVTNVNATEPYAYDVDATDGDGDTLVFTLTTAAAGMIIDPASGLITWNPAEADEGNHTISILVDDQKGGTDSQSFTLSVLAPNHPPIITSSAPNSADWSGNYVYQVTATDADGDLLSYSLTDAPTGMSIDVQTGLITWPIEETVICGASFNVFVSDGRGGSDDQTNLLDFDFALDFDENLAAINITANQQIADPFGHTPFAWIALNSNQRTAKVDSATGQIMAAYRTNLDGVNAAPYHAVADGYGGAHVFTPSGLAHIAAPEMCECEDRNGNGVIDTSMGYNDVLPWSGALSDDECITRFVNTPATSAPRFVALDQFDGLWLRSNRYYVFDANTYALIREEIDSTGLGNNPGFIHDNQTMWASNQFGSAMFWDMQLPLNTSAIQLGTTIQFLAKAPDGTAWATDRNNTNLYHFDSAGQLIETLTLPRRGTYITVDDRGHIWVGVNISPQSISHLLPDGTYLGDVPWFGNPDSFFSDRNGNLIVLTGIQIAHVDRDGGPLGADGVTPIGEMTYRSGNIAGFQQKEDATGITIPGTPQRGSLTYLLDSGTSGHNWSRLAWSADVPTDAILEVRAATTDDASIPVARPIDSDADHTLPPGRYLYVHVLFQRSPSGDSPTLNHLMVIPPAAVGPADESFTLLDTDSFFHTAINPYTDPAGFALLKAPNGVVLDEVTGALTWDPTIAQLGNHQITLVAFSANCGQTLIRYDVTVNQRLNNPPIITSTPTTNAYPHVLWQYQVEANDADGDPLTFELIQGPTTMSLNATGQMDWVPGNLELGDHPITVRVVDPYGASDTQDFNLSVTDNRPPVFVSTPTFYALPGETYSYQALAIDPEGDPLTYVLVTAPSGMAIDPTTGLLTWPGTVSGAHSVAIQANDPSHQTQQSFTLTVGDQDLLDLCVVVEANAPTLSYDDAKISNNQSSTRDVLCDATPKTKHDPTHSIFQSLPQAAMQVSGTDLVVLDVNADNVVADAQGLYAAGTLHVVLANQGDTDADQPLELTVFEDINLNHQYDAGDTLFLTYQFPGIIAGEQVAWDIFVDGPVSFRDAPITVWVDSTQAYSEPNESNNLRHSGQNRATPAQPRSLDPVVKWAWSGSLEYPEYDEIIVTPLVANITDDNSDGVINEFDIPDVVVVAAQEILENCGSTGYLFILSGDTGELKLVMDQIDVMSCTTPAIGDVDGDGFPEIVTMSKRGGLINWVVIEHDGTEKFRFGGSSPSLGGAPLIADLDGDGQVELVTNGFIYNGANGQRISSIAYTGNSLNVGIPISADLNLDGTQELVLGRRAMRMDGTLVYQTGSHRDENGFSAVGNFDADAFPEIVTTSAGSFLMQEHDGTLKWGPIPFGRSLAPESFKYSGSPPVVADVNGDDVPEIIVADDQVLAVYDANGQIVWTTPVYETSSGITSPTAFDLDGDGDIELIYSDQTLIRIYDGATGAVQFEFPNPSATLAESPVVADLDRDGSAEIIAISNSALGFANEANFTRTGVTVFEDAERRWGAARSLMNQHAYSVTNINDDGSIPRIPEPNWLVPEFNHFRVNSPLPTQYGLNAAADLTASYLRLDHQNCPTSVNLKARIGNGGAVNAPAGVTVTFYSGGCSGTQLGSTIVPVSLPPGAWVDVELDYVPGNLAPVFTSTPVVNATEDAPYQYQAIAIDPESQAVSYALLTAPLGMTIDTQSGLIDWNPTFESVGNRRVTIAAYDPLGAASTQSFMLHVDYRPNHPPVITSAAPPDRHIVRYQSTFTYQVTADDLDGDPLTYSLTQRPTGASIDPLTGLISWSPASNQIGQNHNFTVKVVDDYKGFDTQSFRLSTLGVNQPPVITSTPPLTVVAGSNYLYQITVTDDTPTTTTVTGLPDGMNFVASGRYLTWPTQLDDVGLYPLHIEVTDGEFITVQDYVLEVLEWINTPPTITSTPVIKAITGQAYFYDVNATDVDAQTITYGLDLAPPGMTINATNGQVNWTAPAPGAYPVIATATDTAGGQDRQGFTVLVPYRSNTAPVITSTPIDTGLVGVPYSYDVAVTDPDGYPLSFTLTQAPIGMVIQPSSGEITWLPDAVGSYPVTVQVADAMDASDSQSYTLVVTDPGDITPPQMQLDATLTLMDPSQPSTLTVTASDNQGIASLSLTIDGVPLPLDGNQQAVFSSATPGVFRALATATDTAGLTSTDELTLRVRDAADTDPPLVDLIDPVIDSVVTQPVSVTGTVQDNLLDRWVLEYQYADTACWTLLTQGTDQLTAADLATFDPTLLKNGLYEIRLTAWDVNNRQASDFTVVLVDGNMKVGKFEVTFQDLSIPLHGIPINIFRTYDSSQSCPGDFGYNWDLATIDVQENVEPGSFWELNEYLLQLPLPVPTYCVEGVFDHYVSVTLPGGKTEQFDLVLYGNCQDYQQPEQVTVGYAPRPGTTSQLFLNEDNRLYPRAATGDFKLLTLSGEVWDPSEYLLVTADGITFSISQYDGLRFIQDREGNYVSYDSTGIVHSSGDGIYWTRDNEQRITTITDPAGNSLHYSYDAAGDLVAFTDRMGHTTHYSYGSNHQLIDITTPNGEVPARMEYDADGRLIAQVDANGNRISYNHDIAGRQETITDRHGNLWAHTYDDRGNVLATVDPSGATTAYTYDSDDRELSKTIAYGTPLEATTSRSYDSRDNILSETDPLGHTVSYSYTASNEPLTITDPAGKTTSFTYDQYGFPLTITDPLGGVTESVYTVNAAGNLVTTTTDPLGYVSVTEQNRKGHILRETDAAGTETTYTYDANGNQLTRTTLRTNDQGQQVSLTWTTEYDANDRAIRELDPYGNETRTEYDAVGQVTAQIDALGRRSEMTYDAFGRVVRSSYPDGSVEVTTYDEDGNQLTATDRAGRMVSFSYDELNRLTAATAADGSITRTEYDVAGQVEASIDARGYRTEYGYDLAGRRTSVTDARFQTSSYSYDARGNQLSFTDALGHITSFEYDDKSRRTRTVFHDGSDMSVAYDALDRKVTETDQAGIATHFSYDGLGRLVQVTDAHGQLTQYAYDEQGNRTAQIDALGRTTSWSYDHLGRAVKRTLPLGMFETLSYDGVGNLTAMTDFNGNTTHYGYDVLSRPIVKTYADASQQQMGYNELGLRTHAQTADGTTFFFYDLSDRLIHQENPDGTWLVYEYDEAGNRTAVETPNGLTTYSYDPLNRLEVVTAPDGTATTYDYDAVGNRQRVQMGNGTETFYVYDDLNRLTYMEHKDGAGTVLASFTYTLGPAGNRLSVTDHTGRVVDYTYDDLYRLTREEIADPTTGTSFFAYTYDAVANRLTKEDVNGVVTSTYDDNDRILTRGGDSYSYDLNGNTLTALVAGVTTHYAYDYENRMVGADDGSKLVAYGYNADGIRTWSEVDGLRTHYLVDQNRDYAQVLEELDAGFVPSVTYVHGDDLLSQFRDGTRYSYHYDGHGSTIALTDHLETVTDTYTYDAWGELLASTGATPNNYLYTGEQYDPNVGFYYLRARYYNPSLGRFHTMDTWPGMQFEPVSLHKYLYTHANPLNGIDPSGMFNLKEAYIALAIASVIVNTAQATYHVIKAATAATPEEAARHSFYASLNTLGVFTAFIGGGFIGPSGSFAAATGPAFASAAVARADLVIGSVLIPSAQAIVSLSENASGSTSGSGSGAGSRSINVKDSHVNVPKHNLDRIAPNYGSQKASLIDAVKRVYNGGGNMSRFSIFQPNSNGSAFEATLPISSSIGDDVVVTIRWFEYASGKIEITTAFVP
ncbi:MAG: hypothetical protein KDC35_21035 [Acidobacteria bacterium]|nr:hypothetical protein [Acidobacteriota bacterium]